MKIAAVDPYVAYITCFVSLFSPLFSDFFRFLDLPLFPSLALYRDMLQHFFVSL